MTTDHVDILINAIKELLHVIDQNYKITLANKVVIDYLKQLNLDHDPIGKNLFEIFPFLTEKHKKEYESVFSSEKVVETTETNEFGGRIYYTHTKKIPLFTNGEVTQVITIIDDISTQRLEEEKYRNLIENMSSGVAIYEAIDGGKDFVIKEFNKAAEQITATNKEDAINERIGDIFPSVVEFGLFDIIKDVYRTGISQHHPTARYQDDRLAAWYQNFVYKLDSGEVVAVFDNISAQKIAEEMLRESEEKFRTIAEQSIMAIAIIQDGVFKYANETGSRIIGYSNEELTNLSFEKYIKLIHPEDVSYVIEQGRKKQKGDQSAAKNYSYRIINKEGEIKWVDNFSTPIIYEGKPASLAIILDITEKKAAEQQLKESESKYRTIIEQSLVGIFIIQDNQIKFANEGMAIINEFTIDEMLEWTIQNIGKGIHPEDRPFILQRMQDYQEKKENTTPFNIFRVITKSGSVKWVNSYTKQILFQGKKAIMIIAFDATDEVKAKMKLEESEENYKEAFTRANFYKDLFAHDINNILQNILSSSELLLFSSERQDYMESLNKIIEIIRKQVERGAKLVENVQKLSNIEESEIRLEPIQMIQEIKKAIISTRDGFADKNIEFHLDFFKEAVYVKGNEFLIDIFENILFNAARYNDTNKIKIRIKVSRTQKYDKKFIKTEIIDNGRGIEDRRKKTIFQRSVTHDRNVSGMGLGLSLVRKIIENYGGNIWIEDKIKGDHKKGSKFILLMQEVD